MSVEAQWRWPAPDRGAGDDGTDRDHPIRLAIVASHPIQYHGPLFARLARRDDMVVRVFYMWEGSTSGTHDPGFDRTVTWDVPLLDGYQHEFVPNVARDPGTHHFRGLDNPELIDRLSAWRADAVLVFGWAWKSHLHALRALHGRVPILFRGDSTLLDETHGIRRVLRRILLRWVYRNVDLALYPGTEARAYFRAHGLHDEELVWGPHAVDNEAFAAHDARREQYSETRRAELGIPEDDVVFLFAGKLEPRKSPELLLDAFIQLRRSDVHLVIAGSGPLESRLRGTALAHPRVHFVGFTNQSAMPVTYRIGDVIILPSRSETWGLAVNEAMACGRPVIVTDRVGCAPDLVADPAVGRIVPAEDVEALADAMAALADAPGLRTTMRAAARANVAAWSLDVLADAVVSAARRVAR